MAEETLLRIGELGRRSGVSPDLLRAWERRYGLLHPVRSSGGLRLYSLADVERVRLMQQHLASGLAAAEAAGLVANALLQSAATPALEPADAVEQLAHALDEFDEGEAQALIDDLIARVTLDALLTSVVLPYLRQLGERWQSGTLSVAQEHFASSVIRGRLLGLARGWGRGFGPRVLLACAPGEQHDLGLIVFGLALRARGWRVDYLGSDTPIDSVVEAARSLEPALVVVSATTGDRIRPIAAGLKEIATRALLGIGGVAATDAAALPIDALALGGDPVTEAERVTALVLSAGA